MKNLSMQEQKQIVGGSYTLKVYRKSDHAMVYLNKNATQSDIDLVNRNYNTTDYTIIVYSN